MRSFTASTPQRTAADVSSHAPDGRPSGDPRRDFTCAGEMNSPLRQAFSPWENACTPDSRRHSLGYPYFLRSFSMRSFTASTPQRTAADVSSHAPDGRPSGDPRRDFTCAGEMNSPLRQAFSPWENACTPDSRRHSLGYPYFLRSFSMRSFTASTPQRTAADVSSLIF